MLMPSVFGKDLFDDFFDFPFYDDGDMEKMQKKLYGHRGKNLMKTDVQESDDSYLMEMGLLDKDGKDMPLQLANEKEAQGTSRVIVSERASDAEAEKLAERENKADIIAGLDLSGETQEVTDGP